MAYAFNDDKSKAEVYTKAEVYAKDEIESVIDSALTKDDVAWLDFRDDYAHSTTVPANSSATVDMYMGEESYDEAVRRKYNTNDYMFMLAELALSEKTGVNTYTFDTPLIMTGYQFRNDNGVTQLRLYVYNPTGTSRSVSIMETISNVIAIKKTKLTFPR